MVQTGARLLAVDAVGAPCAVVLQARACRERKKWQVAAHGEGDEWPLAVCRERNSCLVLGQMNRIALTCLYSNDLILKTTYAYANITSSIHCARENYTAKS